GRLAGADDVEVRRVQVDNVAKAGNAHRPVRVVGQDRPAGGGARGRDGPVVGALGLVGGDRLGELDLRGRLSLLAASDQRLEVHRGCAQKVVLQDVGRDDARIEAGGNGGRVRRLQLAPQAVGGETAGAGDLGAGDLGGHVG